MTTLVIGRWPVTLAAPTIFAAPDLTDNFRYAQVAVKALLLVEQNALQRASLPVKRHLA